MDYYETNIIEGGNGEIPKKYNNIEIYEVDSIGNANTSQILKLLITTKRFFILKSKNGWQYMTIQFIPSDVSAFVKEKTTPVFASVEELEATRNLAASPFRPRRKKLQKSGKKVSKKSGKVRKNKKSKKLRN